MSVSPERHGWIVFCCAAGDAASQSFSYPEDDRTPSILTDAIEKNLKDYFDSLRAGEKSPLSLLPGIDLDTEKLSGEEIELAHETALNALDVFSWQMT